MTERSGNRTRFRKTDVARQFAKLIQKQIEFADQHRGMYVADANPRVNLEVMCAYLEGYWNGTAVGLQHKLSSGFSGAFSQYLRRAYGWSASLGPARMLIDNSQSSDLAWERFWVELSTFAQDKNNLR